MSHSTDDIESIIIACKRNERSGQKALYQRYYSFSLSICMRYASSRDDAVEIMNDGFFKVFKYIDSYSMSVPFEPWLKRIMINCSIDWFRRTEKRAKENDLRLAQHIAEKPAVLEAISYDEMLELVRQLSDAYRTVFNLIAIEGYTHHEVAEMLDISIGTSKSNYARAKRKLQELLKEYFGVNHG